MAHNNRRHQTAVCDAIDTVSDKAKEAVEMINLASDKAKERVKELAADTGGMAVHAKDRMQDLGIAATEKASAAVQGAGHEITALIRRYPVQSLLVGLAAGFLLARTTTRD